jgi:hypothetical protein
VISATVATLSVFAMRRLLPDICRFGVAIATPSTAGIGSCFQSREMTNAPRAWARGVKVGDRNTGGLA